MANTIEYGKIFQPELDKQMAADAVTGWMEINSRGAKYNGGADIKIPKMTMDGLGDYDRATGYPEGDVTLEFQTMQLTQDRGRGFTLDAQDVDESNFAASAGNVMGEFQRAKVIPEVDMYRLNKLYTLAGDRKRTYTAAAATVWGALMDDIAAVQDKAGTGLRLVVHMSITAHAILGRAAEYTRSVSMVDFQRGEITTKVRGIDGTLLIPTQSKLMQTVITKQDGRTAGQEGGGYKVDAASKGINWIIMVDSAPIAVSKTDLPRVFDPQTYQKSNAWHIDYRKYHDLWVTANKLDSLYANVAA